MKSGALSRVGLKSTGVAALLLLLPHVAGLGVARAQQVVARVTSVQHVVEKRSGAGPFRKAALGATLGVGDSLRTGKRSKADLKFADGSMVRLGSLTTVEIQSARGIRLTRGRLLYANLKPGRVLRGQGAARPNGSRQHR